MRVARTVYQVCLYTRLLKYHIKKIIIMNELSAEKNGHLLLLFIEEPIDDGMDDRLLLA